GLIVRDIVGATATQGGKTDERASEWSAPHEHSSAALGGAWRNSPDVYRGSTRRSGLDGALLHGCDRAALDVRDHSSSVATSPTSTADDGRSAAARARTGIVARWAAPRDGFSLIAARGLGRAAGWSLLR